MLRYAFVPAMLAAAMMSTPSLAVSKEEKQKTCEFGAQAQNLQGAELAKFMKNCMANRNDPRGPARGAAAPKQ